MQKYATLNQASNSVIVDNKWDLQQGYEEHTCTCQKSLIKLITLWHEPYVHFFPYK